MVTSLIVVMQLPQWLARFNRHVTNPIQRMWAGWAPTMGILEHAGRRSGKRYRTPLTVFSTEDGVAILLTYGPDRDWLKNLQATNGGRVKVGGKTFDVTNPRVVETAEAVGLLKPPWRQLLGHAGVAHTLLLTRT